MTDHLHWTEQLSDYLDGALSPERQRAMRDHLAGCGECARALEELRAVVAWAERYRPPMVSGDGWPAIRERIEREKVVAIPRLRDRRFGWQGLVAAGLAMATIAGGSVWYLSRPTPLPDPIDPRANPPVMVEASTGDFDAAVQELEQLLAADRGRLDTATVRVVEESLRTIDQAIAEARAAVQRDSSQAYLNGRIAAHMRQKLAILRMATRAVHSET
ncbi:MAG: zf-HC2 domain-containing protein [Gemmatimonadales bacterium]